MLEKENRMFEQFLKRLDPKDFQLKGILFHSTTTAVDSYSVLRVPSSSYNTLVSTGHAEEESENKGRSQFPEVPPIQQCLKSSSTSAVQSAATEHGPEVQHCHERAGRAEGEAAERPGGGPDQLRQPQSQCSIPFRAHHRVLYIEPTTEH